MRRRALLIAALDPEGYTSHRVSDFANGTLVEAMAYAYDYCHDVFREEELAAIREAMLARLAVVARIYRPGLEQRVDVLALRAFDLYVGCRTRIFELRIDDLRRNHLDIREQVALRKARQKKRQTTS